MGVVPKVAGCVLLIDAGDPTGNHWSFLVMGNCGVGRIGLIGDSKLVFVNQDIMGVASTGDMKLGPAGINDGHCRGSTGSSSAVVEGGTLFELSEDRVSVDVGPNDPGSVVVEVDHTGFCRRLLRRLLVGLVLVEGGALLELSEDRVSVDAGPVDPGSVVVDVTVDVVSFMLGVGKLL